MRVVVAERTPEKEDSLHCSHLLFLPPLVHTMGTVGLFKGSPHLLVGRARDRAGLGLPFQSGSVPQCRKQEVCNKCVGNREQRLRPRVGVWALVPQFPQTAAAATITASQPRIWEEAPGWHQGGLATGWSGGPQSVAFVLFF